MPRLDISKMVAAGYTPDEVKQFANSRGIQIYDSTSQQQPQAEDKGNILTNSLPLIGSIGGGIIGAAGGLPGIVAGSAIGGGLGKAGENYFEEGKINPGEVGKEAALSGVFGLAGGGIGKILGKGALAGAKGAGSSVIRSGAKAGARPSELDDIFRVSQKYGKRLTGSAGKRATTIENEIIPETADDLIKILSESDPVERGILKKGLKLKMLKSSRGTDTAEYKRAVDFYLKQLDDVGTSNADLAKFRQSLFSQTQGGGAQPGARKVAVQEMYDGLTSALKGTSKKAASIIDEQPTLYKLLDVTAKEARTPVHIPFLGNSNLLRAPFSALQNASTRATGALGGAAANPLVNQPVAQIAGQTLTGGLGGDQPPVPGATDQFDTGGLPGGATQPPTQQPDEGPISQVERQTKVLQAMAIKDLEVNGGKNISKIIALQKFLAPEGEGQNLTEGQRNTISNLSKTQDVIKKLAKELDEIGLEENPLQARIQGTTTGLLGKAGLAGRRGERLTSFNRIRYGMRVQIARGMGEVGNLSEPEQRAALDLLPAFTDSKFEVQEKVRLIVEILDEAKARAGSTPGGGYTPTTGVESLSDEYLYQ